MTFPVQIHFHGIEQSHLLEEKIRERIDALAASCPRLTACRVVVNAPHVVHVSVRLPRTIVSVTKGEPRKGERLDLSTVIRQTFDAADRAVREFSERTRA